MGFFTKNKEVRPITKPLSEFSRKKIQGSQHFKTIAPTKHSLIRRLKALDPTNIKLAPYTRPKTEYIFDAKQHRYAKVLRYGKISFDFDGRHVEDDIVIVPHEFWAASWSRTKPEVYIDDNVYKKYYPFASLHEAIEKDLTENHTLEPDIEAHDVTDTIEHRTFLKNHTPEQWTDYDKHINKVQRKEWVYLKQFGTPMLTPIIRTHHGGGKRSVEQRITALEEEHVNVDLMLQRTVDARSYPGRSRRVHRLEARLKTINDKIDDLFNSLPKEEKVRLAGEHFSAAATSIEHSLQKEPEVWASKHHLKRLRRTKRR